MGFENLSIQSMQVIDTVLVSYLFAICIAVDQIEFLLANISNKHMRTTQHSFWFLNGFTPLGQKTFVRVARVECAKC